MKKKNENELNPGQKKLLRAILVRRSGLGESETAKDSIEDWLNDSRPDLAHHTYKMGVSSGGEFRSWVADKFQAFQEIQFKFAFHDLLNSDLGYTPFSQLDFPALTLRYYDKSQKLINEEMDKMKHLLGYNKKTQ